MKRLFIGGLSLAVAGLLGEGKGAELTQELKTEYIIVQSTNATPAEKYASRELCEFLEKATGTKFAAILESQKPLPQKAIYVGWTDFASRQADLSALGQEDWIIKTEGQNLILTGGRPRGTLYAVYEYLEQEIGCHWLDEFTEVVPSHPKLKLKKMDIKGRPLLWSRAIYTASDHIFDQELLNMFNTRNKDSKSRPEQYGFGGVKYGSPNMCHTFYDYSLDWQTNYPEYLAMNDKGERVCSTSGLGPGQLCLTNPEMRKSMLKKLRNYITTDRKTADKEGCPPPRIYCIEPNDCELSCRCPSCKAFSDREGSDSGPLVDLVNYLADGVRDEFPDVLIDTFAYQQTCKPPKTVRPRDNVIIRLAQLNAEWTGDAVSKAGTNEYPDLFRPMTNEINRSCYETLVNWAQISKHMSIWDYWVLYDYNGNNRFMTPYVNLACISSDMELFLNSHVETIFVECEHPETSSFFALKRWLGLKLMQDPHQSYEALVKTFMSGYYGPAYKKMNEYLTYMEKRINAVPATKKISEMLEQNRPYLDLAFYMTSIKMLDEAEKLCGMDKAALLHVQREKIPVDSGLLGMWDYLQKKLPAGKTMPFDRDAVLKRYETMRLGQIEVFYAKEKQADGKKKLEEHLSKFKK